jgi:hypothetical protein
MGAGEAVRAVARLFEIAVSGDNPAYFFQGAFRAANDAVTRRVVDGGAGGAAGKASIQFCGA